MATSKYDQQIERLAKRPVFTASQAREQGIPSRMLSHFCEKGIIQRIGRGVYMGVEVDLDAGIEFEWEDLALIAMSIPKGVVCLISALCYYNLTDQIMREFWIAIPNESKKLKRPGVRCVRMRNMTLGLTEVSLGKYMIKMFDPERTVVDAFRYLGREVSIKALRLYLAGSGEKKPDLGKLTSYARKMRIDIHQHISILMT